MSNIFGGNTPWTYDDVQRKRRIASQLQSANSRTPRNAGEGLHAIGLALAARNLDRRAGRREDELRGEFNEQFANRGGANVDSIVAMLNNPLATSGHKSALEALLAGVPGYRKGTRNAPGGLAVVGEEGPEVIELPEGSKVTPFDPRGPNPLQPPLTPDAQPPEDYQQFDQNDMMGRFNDANAVKVADLGGINAENMTGANRTNAQNSAFAYRALMSGLDDYERQFKESGGTVIPGAQKDSLDTARRNLQMQMKELYNLGVLNGPDLALMDQILVNPTGIGNNILDVLGISDLDERVPANIEQVRRLMTQMVEPRLQALGVSPEDVLAEEPADLSTMSDEDLLKMLGGS